MKYDELSPVRDLLNRKFKGKQLPGVAHTVRDFIILPNEKHDKKSHDRCIYALDIGVPSHEVEDAIKHLPHLEIRIRFTNKEMKGAHHLRDFGFSGEELENFNFS